MGSLHVGGLRPELGGAGPQVHFQEGDRICGLMTLLRCEAESRIIGYFSSVNR